MQGEDCKPPVYEDEIDLLDLVKVLWKRRRFIAIGVVASTCLVTALVLVMPRAYRSQGFYRLSGSSFVVSQPEYKIMHACFENNEAFHRFLAKKRKEMTLMDVVNMSRGIEPVYAFAGKVTGKNIRRLRIGNNDYITGVDLYVDCNNPKEAMDLVKLMGEWIKDCVLKTKVKKLLDNNYYNALKVEERLDVRLNKNRQLLVQMEKELKSLEEICGRSVKYLSKDSESQLGIIFTKLTSMQERVIDLKSQIIEDNLSYKRASVKRNFFGKLLAKIGNSTDLSGQQLLSEVLLFKDVYFSSMPQTEIVRMVREELTTIFQKLKGYSDDIGFARGPSVPLVPIKPRRKLIVALSLVLSLFFFIFMAFILEWWSANKEEFTS